MDYMGPVPIQEVRASRQKIIEQLRQLVERGEIVLQYTDAELFLMQKKTIFKAAAPNRKTV
ncbi:MAG: FliG C-terminal domain-containing protein [Treponema sp.]